MTGNVKKKEDQKSKVSFFSMTKRHCHCRSWPSNTQEMMINNEILWTVNTLLTDRRPRPAPPSQSERGASGPLGPGATSGTSGCCCSYWGNLERRSGPPWRSSSILHRRLTGEARRTTVSTSTLHYGDLNFNHYCYVSIVLGICEYCYVYYMLIWYLSTLCIWYRYGRWKLACGFIMERQQICFNLLSIELICQNYK